MAGIGLNASLLMGTRSLTAQRQAIEVVGHNLANVNTPGSARQRVVLQQDTPFDSPIAIQGLGARVGGVQSLRSALLDQQVVRQESLAGFHEERHGLASLVEQSLGENLTTSEVQTTPGVSSLTGIGHAIEAFFDAWQALASDPTSNVARAEVLTRAQGLASDIRSAYDRVLDIKDGLFPAAASSAETANQLAAQIGDLNRDITRAEVSTQQPANDLRDRRQQIVEQLAREVNITVTPNAANPRMLDVALADAPGVLLVSGIDGGGAGTSYALELNAPADRATNAALVLRAVPASGPTVVLSPAQPTEGRLGALVSTANVTIGSSHAAGASTIAGRLNQLALNLRDGVNAVHAGGQAWDANGNAGADFFAGTGADDFAVVPASAGLVAAAAGAAYPGPLDGSGARAIAALRDNAAYGEYHRETVTGIGFTVQQARRDAAAQDLVSKQIFREREGVSGISIDEEMTNLVSFQRAYEASARFVGVVDEMMRTLTNLGR